MTPAVLSSEIRELYKSGSARIQQQFATTGDGRSAVVQRTALVDGIAARLWEDLLQPHVVEQGEFALVAIGGYGRASLFPYSDVDLLFLHTNSDAEEKLKDPIRAFSQELWDLGIKLSPASRTLAECDRFDPNNVEAAIALLDCRFLAGSRELFLQLHDHVVTRLTVRDGQSMAQRLVEITRNRHARQGGTVFHLEPNVKDAPGGLRDYNVAHWLGLIAALNKLQSWPEPEQVLPASMRRHVDAALEFLVAVRCFLHFRHKRDDNSLTWTAQDEAASRNIGVNSQAPLAPADWMRIYFQHARAVHRICRQLLDEVPAAWSSLYRQFQSWRSRISTSEFSVVQGMVFLPQAAAVQDPETLLRLFHFVAHHGVKLSTTTEQRIEQALPAMAATPPRGTELWIYLQEILLQPHAAEALRSMHALRFLTMVLPELEAIDALVVR
ncbi:MAG TPA: [protein-PII] uridylyltransferase, partial [Terriglobales bacterium]|nr:[protein-PII] uridylyltransferase [Terriglobales bacterium]